MVISICLLYLTVVIVSSLCFCVLYSLAVICVVTDLLFLLHFDLFNVESRLKHVVLGTYYCFAFDEV